MNAQQKYLAWLRITAPETYMAALRTVARQPRGLGGLSDDLLTRMKNTCTGFGFLGDDINTDFPDLQTITVTADATPSPDLSSLVLDPQSLQSADLTSLNQVQLAPISEAPTSGSPGIFDSIVKAVAGVATTALTVSNQSNLLKVNTQRAAQGLPPVDANGRPISNSFFKPSTNPSLAAFEARIGSIASSPLVWVAGLGILAYLLLGKRARA